MTDETQKVTDTVNTVVNDTTAAVEKSKSLWGNYQDWIVKHPKTLGIVVPVVVIFLLTLAIRV